MKKLKYLFLGLSALTAFTACNSEAQDEAEVFEGRGTAGILINVSQNSSGALLGSPEAGVDLADAQIAFSADYLDFVITSVSGDFDSGDVDRLEIYKSYNGGEQILVGETTELPYSFSYESIDGFVEGTGLTADQLRIGDVFTFAVKVVKNNGAVYSYGPDMGRFSLTINCSYDLAGTYLMSNDVCNNPQTVTISQNSDGTWYASTADGGLLQFCSSNTGLQNDGSFAVGCGGVVDATATAGGPAYCSGGGYGIGCIAGGTWDQEAGILKLDHTNAFFTWASGEYTSTYVRQ